EIRMSPRRARRLEVAKHAPQHHRRTLGGLVHPRRYPPRTQQPHHRSRTPKPAYAAGQQPEPHRRPHHVSPMFGTATSNLRGDQPLLMFRRRSNQFRPKHRRSADRDVSSAWSAVCSAASRTARRRNPFTFRALPPTSSGYPPPWRSPTSLTAASAHLPPAAGSTTSSPQPALPTAARPIPARRTSPKPSTPRHAPFPPGPPPPPRSALASCSPWPASSRRTS